MPRRGEMRVSEAMGRIAKGWIAGTAGTGAMTLAQTRLLPKIPSGPSGLKPRFPRREGEPATETAARRVVEGLATRRLPEKQKKVAGNLVHYATGAAWAGLFALAAQKRPTLSRGLAFGALVWVLNDNLLAPSFRFSDWPWRYSPADTVKGLLAHLVYGAGSALALRSLRVL